MLVLNPDLLVRDATCRSVSLPSLHLSEAWHPQTSTFPSSPDPQRMQRPQTPSTNFTSHHRACAFHLLAFGSLLSIGSFSSINQSNHQPLHHAPIKSTLSHDCQTWLLTRVPTARRVTTRLSLPHPQVLTTPSATPQPPSALPRSSPSPLSGTTSPACPTSHLLTSGLTPPPPSRLTSAPWHPPQALATRPPRSSHLSHSRQTSRSQSS